MPRRRPACAVPGRGTTARRSDRMTERKPRVPYDPRVGLSASGRPVPPSFGPGQRLAMAGMGSFDWDLDQGVFDLDEAGLRVFDLRPEEFNGRPDALVLRVAPRRATAWTATLRTAVQSRAGAATAATSRSPAATASSSGPTPRAPSCATTPATRTASSASSGTPPPSCPRPRPRPSRPAGRRRRRFSSIGRPDHRGAVAHRHRRRRHRRPDRRRRAGALRRRRAGPGAGRGRQPAASSALSGEPESGYDGAAGAPAGRVAAAHRGRG